MSHVLAILPIPFEDESAASIIQRAASINGYKPHLLLAALARTKGLDFTTSQLRTIASSPTLFRKTCKAIGIPVTDDHPAHPIYTKQTLVYHKFFRIDVQSNLLRRSAAYCPLCLKEKGYWSRMWQHALMKVCIHHEVKLVDSCYQCSEPINPNKGTITHCHCRALLSDAIAIPADKSASKRLHDILQHGTNQQHDDYVALHKVLTKFIGDNEAKVENLLALGFNSSVQLARKLSSFYTSDRDNLTFLPQFSFFDFFSSDNEFVKAIGQEATKFVPKEFLSEINPPSYDIKTNLRTKQAATMLMIEPSDIGRLRRKKLLESYKVTPSEQDRFPQSSINSLLFKLSNIDIHESKRGKSLRHLINDKRYLFGLDTAIQGILDGNIKMTHFAWHESLYDIEIIEPKKMPRKKRPLVYKTEYLVSLQDFSDFTGLHANVIREMIKSTSDIIHFNDGKTFGNKKFLTPEDSIKLLDKFKTTLVNKQNKMRVQALSNKDIPVLPVDVGH